MAATRKYGITYPFTANNNDGYYLDLNETYADGIKSQVLHVIFTPKGQKLRDPNFGTDLIKYIFSPSDTISLEEIKREITTQVSKYVPSVMFRDVTIHTDESDDNGIIVMVEYGVKKGEETEITTVGIKL